MQIIGKGTGEKRNDLSIEKAKENGFWIVEDNAPILQVDIKYWKDGANVWTPVAMSAVEIKAIDNAGLLSVKQAKWREIEAKANAEIDTVIGGENGKGYVLGEIFLRTMTDSTENLLTTEQILQLKQTIELVVAKTRQKYALIMAPDVTAEELSTVVW